jgi:hypothetical protein
MDGSGVITTYLSMAGLMANVRKQSESDKLDEAIEQTFPASDPPANTVGTGVRIFPPRARAEQPRRVRDGDGEPSR